MTWLACIFRGSQQYTYLVCVVLSKLSGVRGWGIRYSHSHRASGYRSTFLSSPLQKHGFVLYANKRTTKVFYSIVSFCLATFTCKYVLNFKCIFSTVRLLFVSGGWSACKCTVALLAHQLLYVCVPHRLRPYHRGLSFSSARIISWMSSSLSLSIWSKNATNYLCWPHKHLVIHF